MTEEQLVKLIVGSYPQINKTCPCSFALFNNDLTQSIRHLLYVCHAPLRTLSHNIFDVMLTSYPRQQALDLQYLEWLLNGPFRAYKEKVELLGDIGEFYLRITELDKWPSQILYNFCIATRVPVEFPDTLKIWGQLVGAGVDPSLAFILAPKFHYNGGHKKPDPWAWCLSGLTQCSSGHFWFDPVSSWNRIINGQPSPTVSRFFKSSPGSSVPCNVIWGSCLDEKPNVKELIGKTVKEISDAFGLTPNKVDPEVELASSVFVVHDNEDNYDDDDDDDDDDFNWRQ